MFHYRTLVLCYLMYNAKAVYSQGMTDLALPLLSIVKDIPIAFWCFVNLLETHALFMSSQAAQSLEDQIVRLCFVLYVVYFSLWSCAFVCIVKSCSSVFVLFHLCIYLHLNVNSGM